MRNEVSFILYSAFSIKRSDQSKIFGVNREGDAEILDNVSGLCEVQSIWANAVSRKARVIRSGLAKARIIE
jgi:hypothetical protein